MTSEKSKVTETAKEATDRHYRERTNTRNLAELVDWLKYGEESGYIAARCSKEQEEYWGELLEDLLDRTGKLEKIATAAKKILSGKGGIVEMGSLLNELDQCQPDLTTVYCQQWMESERGWGQRPDGFSIHVTKEDVTTYIDQCRKKLPEVVPDVYSRPIGEPFQVKIGPELLEELKMERTGNHYGLRSLEKWPDVNAVIKTI